MTITNDRSSMYVTGGENFGDSTGIAGKEETEGFELPFLGSASNPPSFIGKVYTREELLQSVNNEVRQNQYKKMPLADMIKSSCFEGTRAKFRFAGESKIYTFGEYIQEPEKRSGKEAKGWQ